jgi:acetyl-CoA acetyltransferase
MADEEIARSMGKHAVWLDGVGAATASMSVLRRPELTGLPSAVEASQQAYTQAGIKAAEVDVAEVHDCFTIAELMAYEDLGFCAKGEGGKFIEAKRSYIGGDVAVNVDGGLKAKGHPIGATGVSMAVEIIKQLRGECGERQVPNAKVGLTHNVGGIGQYTFVHVFKGE